MTVTIPDTISVSGVTSSGPVVASGGVQGNLTGNVTGNGAGTWTGPVVGNVAGNASGVAQAQQVMAADGTVTILTGEVTITKASICNITLPPPTAGTDDGKELIFFSETAFAHVITCSDGFNAKGSSGTATASAVANNYLRLIARNGHWRIIGNLNFTIV